MDVVYEYLTLMDDIVMGRRLTKGIAQQVDRLIYPPSLPPSLLSYHPLSPYYHYPHLPITPLPLPLPPSPCPLPLPPSFPSQQSRFPSHNTPHPPSLRPSPPLTPSPCPLTTPPLPPLSPVTLPVSPCPLPPSPPLHSHASPLVNATAWIKACTMCSCTNN